MIALLQRVAHASVTVDGEVTGAIAAGLLVQVNDGPVTFWLQAAPRSMKMPTE